MFDIIYVDKQSNFVIGTHACILTVFHSKSVKIFATYNSNYYIVYLLVHNYIIKLCTCRFNVTLGYRVHFMHLV